MEIAIASGKGGTGKTFVATNLAYIMRKECGREAGYLDCDVEEPNGHLFLPLEEMAERAVTIRAPQGTDQERCDACGLCADACRFNALAVLGGKVLIFPELCHACGACSLACPRGAIQEGERRVGWLRSGQSRGLPVHYALLDTAQGGMSPRLIQQVKECASQGVNILDAPPGTACTAVHTVAGSDLCVLVTELTPFGLHDLKLAVSMCRALGQEPAVLVNRSGGRDAGVREYCRAENLEIVGEIPDDREVAGIYARGQLAAKELPYYRGLFAKLAERLVNRARQAPAGSMVAAGSGESAGGVSDHGAEKALSEEPAGPSNGEGPGAPEVVVLSGKGGTGKTSVAGALAALARKTAVADCDVDASDLHLLLQPEVFDGGPFFGGETAHIDGEKCSRCGRCWQVCRFEAILREEQSSGSSAYRVDELACEGCGACTLVCPETAVTMQPDYTGDWYLSSTRFGPMAHARLGIARENSGRLVSLTRRGALGLARENQPRELIIDGPPGTGCPVISALTGARYALVVSEPSASARHDLERILELCRHFEVPAGVVINKVDVYPALAQSMRRDLERWGAEHLVSLPYDPRVTAAQQEGQTIVEYAPASRTARLLEPLYARLRDLLGPPGFDNPA